MLRAAAELICERGFGDTRIADVAKRAGVSSALVIYYFGTRDRLLVDALRYSEESFYEAAEKMLAEVPSLRERLSLLIKWTCVPEADDEIPAPGDCGSTCGRRLFGTTRSRRAGSSSTRAGASMIVDAVKSAELDTDVDVRMFALEFSALLDGLSIQVALEDPEVDSAVAYDIAMRFAERELNMPRAETVAAGSQETLSAPRSSATGSVITVAELRCSTRTASWVQTQLTRSPGW